MLFSKILTLVNFLSVDSLRNVLLLKPATQSSHYESYNGSLAVDGDRNPNFNLGHCFHNYFETFPDYWLLVDMIIQYKIDYVLLWSRDCLPEHIDKFIIGLTNVNFFDSLNDRPLRGNFPLCGQYPYPPQTSSAHRVDCGSNVTASRYVIAQQSLGASVGFVVCELEAYSKKENVWRRREGMKLTGLKIQTVEARFVLKCVLLCSQLTGCSSVNFSHNSKMCDLNNGTVENVFNIETNKSYDYWQLM